MCGIAHSTDRLLQAQQSDMIRDFAQRYNLDQVTLMPLDGSPARAFTPYIPEPVTVPDWLSINRELST